MLSGKVLGRHAPRSVTTKSEVGERSDADGDRRKTRRRRHVTFEQDAWLTVDDWETKKSAWKEERRLKWKIQVVNSPIQFELHAMDEIAAEKLTQTAKSLLAHLVEAQIPLNYQLVSKCLFMTVSCRDLDGILWCVNWLSGVQHAMDKGTLSNVISGLCLTDRWRESARFVEIADANDAVTARLLEPFLLAACRHGDLQLAEELIGEHFQRGLIPSEESIHGILSAFHCDSADSQFVQRSERIVAGLLDHMRVKRHYPQESIAQELKTWFERKQNESWRASFTKVSQKGICQSCQEHLDSLRLSSEEFNNLRDEIFSKVIRGKDIFKKTTPKELGAFMKFVDGGPPYDIVIDGLNVANIKKRITPGIVLRQFVEYFSHGLGKKCLVLGRQHMLRQPAQYRKQDMEAIQDVADCFFTQNMSEDDPFMLYATLHSGRGARYVTRDLLRDHKALLSPGANLAFIKWQRSQQLKPVDFRGGKAIFEVNLAHDTVIQSTSTSWHIPYDDGTPRFSYQVPTNWLCATRR
ncbi:mitochondrial ribonuclease P catalytic subunit-like [Diadema antillarum]|uniref:mitochondrial ribonuclease P catalytic subunit-like n=1 Tax=Diadema antillarum TaxID=105358 RepID=UPI003A83D7D7